MRSRSCWVVSRFLGNFVEPGFQSLEVLGLLALAELLRRAWLLGQFLQLLFDLFLFLSATLFWTVSPWAVGNDGL